jgi:hypothetical protein
MNKIIAVAFSNETRAYEGLKALKELHAEGSLTIYSAAVITRDADANITVKEWADPGAIRTGLGRVIGGLIVLLRTPDWNVRRCTGRHNCEFSCVIADIDEELVNPLDVRIEPLGGGITRRARWDFVDEIELRSDNRNIASGDSADGACQFQPLEAMPTDRQVPTQQPKLRFLHSPWPNTNVSDSSSDGSSRLERALHKAK